MAFFDCTSLTEVYFKGNAPSVGSDVFDNSNNTTIYYLPGSTGWGTTFGGRPTSLWQPQVQTIEPGQSYSVTVTWLGKVSQKGCPVNQPAAKAGSYKVTGRNGAVVSAPAVFSLT